MQKIGCIGNWDRSKNKDGLLTLRCKLCGIAFSTPALATADERWRITQNIIASHPDRYKTIEVTNMDTLQPPDLVSYGLHR